MVAQKGIGAELEQLSNGLDNVMIRRLAEEEWGAHPYAVRTWIRGRLPWILINLGVADKAEDCSVVNAEHHWYNADGKSSACYHCSITRPGRLWEENA